MPLPGGDIGLPGAATLGTSGTVCSVAFPPAGHLLATTNDEDTGVDLWDVASRTRIGRLGRHTGGTFALAFSHDGKTIVSSSGNPHALETPAEFVLWDVATRRRVRGLTGHTSSSGFMDFSPDDRVLATPHGDGTINLWDVRAGRIVGTLAGHQGLVQAQAMASGSRPVRTARRQRCDPASLGDAHGASIAEPCDDAHIPRSPPRGRWAARG